MKHNLFSMIVASAMIITTVDSCSKADQLPVSDHGGNTLTLPITLNLTAGHWEGKGDEVFVDIFQNVIPAAAANHTVMVYLLSNGKDMLINQPISFMGGALWATSSQTDVSIVYRGKWPNIPYLNIKVVIQ